MSDSTNILDNDMTTVDPSYPLLSAGSYAFKVADIKVEPTKDKLGDVVMIKLALEQEARDVKNQKVFPGLIITDRISLQTTEKYTIDMIQKRLKAFQLAIFKPTECPQKFAPVDQYLGRSLTAKLKIESDSSGTYDDSNRVAKYVPKD